MAVVRGKDFIISIDVDGSPQPICHATDCIIDKQYGTKEITNPLSYWKDYLGDMVGYTIQLPGLVAYTDVVNWVQLEQWADSRTRLSWHATAFEEGGGVVHSGFIIITNLNLTSQFRDVMKFEMNALGCGPMTTALLPISKAVYLADAAKERLPGCPLPYPVSVFWYNEDGSAPGSLIGIAFNADDVKSLFNGYGLNEFYELNGYTSGCDFNLLADWNAPFVPTVVFAAAAPDMGLWSGTDDQGISPDQDENELSSPGYA